MWSACGLCLLALPAAALWYGLPRMCPDWVMEHSPWFEPIVRAQAANGRDHLDHYCARLREWQALAFPALERLLGSHDAQVRIQAAYGARYLTVEGRLPLPESLVARLARSVTGDEEDDVRLRAAEALHGATAPAAVTGLITATRDPSAQVRAGALDALAGAADAEAIRCKVAALTDPWVSIRMAAAYGLGIPGDERLVGILVHVEEQDEDWGVRLVAVDALAHNGTPAAGRALCAILAADQRLDVVDRAIAALGEHAFGDQAEEPLLAALGRSEAAVRAHAARALGAIVIRHPDRVRALLVAHLDDPVPWVRGWVASTLARTTGTAVDVEEIVRRFEDGRLPAPVITGPAEGWVLSANALTAHQQFALLRGAPVTADQRTRLERVELRLVAEGRMAAGE